MKQQRIVVIGGGFGGLLVAKRLVQRIPKRENIEVVLVDAKKYHTYTPWLYGIATTQLATLLPDLTDHVEASGAIRFQRLIDVNRWNIRFRQGVVETVNHKQKRVLFDDGTELEYSKIVLAYGSVVNDFGVEGVRDYTYSIQTVEGAFSVRNRLSRILDDTEKDRTIAIIGSGAVGVETAAELAHFIRKRNKERMMAHKVVILTSSKEVMANDIPFIRQHVLKRLHQLGVEVKFGALVTRVSTARVYYKTDGKECELSSDLTIWAGGLKPNPNIKITGLDQTERKQFKVSKALRVQTGVYAIGDITEFIDASKKSQLPASAWAAVAQAKVVGDNLVAELRGDDLTEFVPPKHWPSVILVGGWVGTATAFGLKLSGFPAFVLRRIVDLRYFLQILPFHQAVVHWWNGSRILMKDEA